MAIEKASSLFVERAHHLGPLIPAQGRGAGRGMAGSPVFQGLAPVRVKLLEPLPEIGPLHIGMVEKIAVAAVVLATLAGKIHLPGNNAVSLLHALIERGYFCRKVRGKRGRFHDFFLGACWTRAGMAIVNPVGKTASKNETPSMTSSLPCFKAYDVRGRVPDELDEKLAFTIGQSYSAVFSPKKIAIGYDVRLSSPALARALSNGFLAAGVDVVDLGLCGTEEIYFAAFHLAVDGGVIVTASHNPADYNGMKFVRQGARPVSGDSGLREIEGLAAQGYRLSADTPGVLTRLDNKPAYLSHLLGYVEGKNLRPLTIVANGGNGCAGPVIDLLAQHLPCAFIRLQWPPDGSFPNGVPNPLLPENREITAKAVREHGADFGLAWDGDFDRCFFFDEQGGFIEGYYLVGLLAEAMLGKNPGGKIIHDPRLVWNTREIVQQAGGIAVQSKTGHAFIKERMRAEDAVYGGEMSAHHYFRDFAYCDSGMIPWLLIAELLSSSGQPLSHLVRASQAAFPVSGEINRRVSDPAAAIARVEAFYGNTPGEKDYTDGLSFAAENFRFNIRSSNTEPVLRLNVETRGDAALLAAKTAELLSLIQE